MKLKEVIDYWKPLKQKQVKESTFAAYCLTCKTVLIPVFGEMEVSEIDKTIARSFAYKALETKARHTVKDILGVLKMLMKFAVEELDQKIPSLSWNIIWPTSNNENYKIERYSQKQVRIIFDYIKEHPGNIATAVMIALTTGMRIGEICALRFSDIDFSQNVIHVNKTMGRIYDSELEKTKIIVNTPKTRNSRRDIPMTPSLKKILKAYAAVSGADYYVISCRDKCIEPRVLRENVARLIKRSGVSPVLKFHAFRHTFATTMIENHVDPKTVSAILGHANVAITLNLYVHPSIETKANAVNKGLKGLL